MGVLISPPAVSFLDGQKQQFEAVVSGANSSAVTWTIGRQYRSGRVITVNGLYTAPAVAGIHDHSRKQRRQHKSALALVVVPQPEAVTISPANASVTESCNSLPQFRRCPNKAVAWAVTRTIMIPPCIPLRRRSETDVITATSQSDSTKSAYLIQVR